MYLLTPPPSENNDFFHVKLVNSKVQMQFDIGDGSTVVPTGKPLFLPLILIGIAPDHPRAVPLTEGSKNLQKDLQSPDPLLNLLPTDVIVGDDEWHKITASRNGREGVVTVDSGNGRIQSFSGRSEGNEIYQPNLFCKKS